MTDTVRRPRILILLPRGETLRNFVYTECIDLLQEHADVFILTIRPNDELWNFMNKKYPHVLLMKPIRELFLPRFLRGLLDLSHGRWIWSKAAQDRWNIRNYEARTWGQRIKRSIKKILAKLFANEQGLRILSWIEKWVSKIMNQDTYYSNILDDIAPNLIFNASHVHSNIAIPIMHIAQQKGINSATFIFSWDNLTSQGRIIPDYDYYFVWNEAIRQQLLEMYPFVRMDQVFVEGTPQFDFHFQPKFYWSRNELITRIGADYERPIILYSTGMANHMPSEDVIVEDLANQLALLPNHPQLVVRVYPKDHTERFEALKQRRPDILFPSIAWEKTWLTPQIEDLYLLTNMLRYADIGINVASTISLELCMFDNPVINIGYNPPGINLPFEYRRYYDFDHYRPLVESGAVTLVTNHNDIGSAVQTALRAPSAQSSNRKAFISQMFGDTLDGYSAKRIAHRLIELLYAR